MWKRSLYKTQLCFPKVLIDASVHFVSFSRRTKHIWQALAVLKAALGSHKIFSLCDVCNIWCLQQVHPGLLSITGATLNSFKDAKGKLKKGVKDILWYNHVRMNTFSVLFFHAHYLRGFQCVFWSHCRREKQLKRCAAIYNWSKV